MMPKYQSRHQSVINRQSDEAYSEDHWLKQFESTLQKTSVQPRGQSLFDEISSIMGNTRSKYPSVQAAVDDMMQRSGLTAYLDNNVKFSSEQPANLTPKTAQSKADDNTPDVIKQNPAILKTLQNIVKETHGNIPIPAIISRLHALHAQDIPSETDWDDEKLIRLVSDYNLQAKKDNPTSYENYDSLGKGDHSDSDVDASNTDAFNILMPAKI